jgi:ketosteroid isomerase-like protein
VRNATYTALVLAALLVGFVAGGQAARDQREMLLQLDREFDEATARGGSEAWASYFAEDGIMMPAGANLVTGRNAIQEAMAQVFADPKFVLRWEPLGAEVSGNIGYTYGLKRSSTGYGKYVSVWKKQRDGSWKIAVEIENPSPAPPK